MDGIKEGEKKDELLEEPKGWALFGKDRCFREKEGGLKIKREEKQEDRKFQMVSSMMRWVKWGAGEDKNGLIGKVFLIQKEKKT